jgi:hypothetical protein
MRTDSSHSSGVNRLQSVSDIFPTTSNPDDPSFIDGRKQELTDAILTILTPRMCPVILGAKGMGKTTLAWQLELAFKGNAEMLDYLGLTAYRSPVEYFHEIFWLNCSRLKSPDGQGLLDALADFLRTRYKALAPGGKLTTVERSTTFSLSMTPKIEVTSKAAFSTSDGSPQLPAEEEILELATEITSHTGHPFLFIIDDIHLVEDVYAFCTFLKDSSFYSPANPRFLLVGTADGLGDLLGGVRDIGGIVAGIELGRLPDAEILKLLRWGIRALKARGYQFEVEDGLLDSLARISAGYPAMASQLARDTIIAAERNGAARITREHLDNAVRNLIISLQPSASRRLSESRVGRLRR